MCGIAGIVEFGRGVDPDMAVAMAEVLRHRGPDEGGLYAGPVCALSVRRLAVQDVLHGHQPAYSEDGRVAVILNGEIYNFAALRAEVEAKGHRVASGSDTDVLPHLYEEYGDAVLHRLRGMFAIAVWDEPRRRLLIARDRLGKKPLYYLHHGSSFRFASEIKAFFADRSVPREPDFEAIHHFLCLQYVPAPWTAFVGVRALPPGHQLCLDDDGEVLKQWWRLARPPALNVDRREAAALVGAMAREAVGLRMVADVPVGAFLSGGTDSACVVAAMAEQASGPVRTFTIGFHEGERDERALASTTARALGTDHTEIVVEPDVAGLLPLVTWHHDQPFADNSSLPTLLLAQETRRHVTVALNGDGGDEAFAGYPRVQRLGRDAKAGVAAVLRMGARAIPPSLNPANPLALARLMALARSGWSPEAYEAGVEIFPEPFLLRAYTPAMRAAIKGQPTRRLLHGALGDDGVDPVWRGQAADYATYLPGALLAKVDVATMAASLEARSPLLDHELVELAASLPTARKVGPGGAKLALRDAFRGIVPDAVLDGPKRGFGIPLDRWFRTTLHPLATAMLAPPGAAVRNVLRGEVIDDLLGSHANGRSRHGTRIFALVALEMWFRTFIESPPPLVAPTGVSLSDLC
ncbi:MAG TPA: asparagine synthase (glutamine-hydrolyzing) [Acidimicrobiales bacterium]|nr:asparagine synthase (glutamine-hydrolyzing) [Acidimicrobiales bacterium]